MASPDTYSTVVIAIFTVVLVFIQILSHIHNKKISKANYRLSLFDKRIEIFLSIRELFSNFITHGEPRFEDIENIRDKAKTAQFLFSGETLKYIREIDDQGFEHIKARQIYKSLVNKKEEGIPLDASEKERIQYAANKMHEVEGWFLKQIQNGRLDEIFKKDLVLEQNI